MSIDQSGRNLKQVVAFTNFPELDAGGGPDGPSFQPVTRKLFFSTTLSNGLSNTGAWEINKMPVQVVLPLAADGSSDGGGATAFLTIGPHAGNFLVVDVANKKVVRVAPPFTSGHPGIDFITKNLVAPKGLAVNSLGNIFVSNTDGTIEQFGSDGTFLGQYAATGLHNMNIVFDGSNLVVATSDGPVIEIAPNGTKKTVGTVAGGDAVAICP